MPPGLTAPQLVAPEEGQLQPKRRAVAPPGRCHSQTTLSHNPLSEPVEPGGTLRGREPSSDTGYVLGIWERCVGNQRPAERFDAPCGCERQ